MRWVRTYFFGHWLAVALAAILFTINPFVYERMANGQVYVVMGYLLLPILLGLAVRPLGSLVATWILGGITLALDIALSIHFLFIAGPLFAIVILVHLGFRQIRVVGQRPVFVCVGRYLAHIG